MLLHDFAENVHACGVLYQSILRCKESGVRAGDRIKAHSLGIHALTQQGERRANSWLFNRRTTQLGEMHGWPWPGAQKCDFILSPALSIDVTVAATCVLPKKIQLRVDEPVTDS